VGGMDKYFQIVKCFRDEDLREIDNQIYANWLRNGFCWTRRHLECFEGLTRHLLKEIKGVEVNFLAWPMSMQYIHTEMTNPTSVSVWNLAN
jgi:aspartyl-tRNA synthetase